MMRPMMRNGGHFNPATQTPMPAGMVVTARKWPKTVAPATMTRIMQEIRAVSLSERAKPCRLRFPPISAMTMVPAAPMAAASVGVNTPTKSPPMTRRNSRKVSIRPVSEAIRSRRDAFGAGTQRPGRRRVQTTMVTMNRTARRMPGRMPATKSLPTDCSVMIP